jgi:nitrate reductase gamma subunit
MLTLLYIALAVCFLGSLIRAAMFSLLPSHLRWELYPIPGAPPLKAEYGGSYFEDSDWFLRPPEPRFSRELSAMLSEVFLLRGVWENQPRLWLWSWLCHMGLYLLIPAVLLAAARAAGAPVSGQANAALAWSSMSCGVVGTSGLIVIRVGSPRLRPYSSRATYFYLILILTLFGTGLASLVAHPAVSNRMAVLAGALLKLNPPPALGGIEIAHLSTLSAFLILFPFTRMTHAFMKFFAYHRVRWDDEPYRRESSFAAGAARNLDRPVTWRASHIRGEDSRSWRQVAANEGTQLEKNNHH